MKMLYELNQRALNNSKITIAGGSLGKIKCSGGFALGKGLEAKRHFSKRIRFCLVGPRQRENIAVALCCRRLSRLKAAPTRVDGLV